MTRTTTPAPAPAGTPTIAPRTAEVRPLLRQDATLLRDTDGGLVACGNRVARMAGRDAFAVLSRLRPYLNGRRTVREIGVGLPLAARVTVLSILEILVDRGLVLDLADPVDGPRLDPEVRARFHAQLCLLAHRGDGAALRFHRFRTSRLLLSGSGPALDATGLELLRSGLGELVVLTDDPGSAPVGRLAAEVTRLRDAGCPTTLRVHREARFAGHDVVVAAGAGRLRLSAVGRYAVVGAAGAPHAACRHDGPDVAPTPLQARILGGELASQVFLGQTGTPSDPVVVDLGTMQAVPVQAAGTGCCPGRLAAAARSAPAHPAPTVTVRDTPVAGTVLGYADAALRHPGRSMPPPDHVVDWADQPTVLPTCPDAVRYALPDPFDPPSMRRPSTAGAAFLGDVLHRTYGVRGRKLRFDSNLTGSARHRFDLADWRRGTASGGGRYPLRPYLVVPAGAGPLPAGVYHYAPGSHAFERVGDRAAAARVTDALDAPAGTPHLVVTARIWANAFKYAEFGYHICTLDVGLLLASVQLLAAELGVPLRRRLWFDDLALGEGLGIARGQEVALAVLELPPVTADVIADPPVSGAAARPFERSRRVTRFAAVERLHATTVVGDRPVPVVPRASPTHRGGSSVALPDVAVSSPPAVAELLDRRTSSFGGLSRRPATDLRMLAALLARTAHASVQHSDLAPDPEAWRFTGLSVLVLDVTGLAPGGYRYDPAARELRPCTPARLLGRWSRELQHLGRNTANYGLDDVAAVLVVTGRLEWALQHYGPRGHRLLNAEAGTVLQAGYLAATATGLGCGAVLTLDHEQVGRLLDLPVGTERAVVCLLLGGEVDGHVQVDQRLG